MARICNLTPADLGCPFHHLEQILKWSGFAATAQTVLETLLPVEREVAAAEDGGHYLMRVLPYQGAEGELDGIVVTMTNITERKRMEDAVLQAKKHWELTFDSVPDLIAILDDRHRIVRVNRAMSERLGVPVEACQGRVCYHCVHGSDEPPESCPHARTIRDGGEHSAEFCDKGTEGDFLVTTTPIRDDGGRVVGSVHVARDISERNRVEEELRRAQGELEQRVRERTAELALAVETLQQETQERLRAFESVREKERLMIQQSRQAAMGEMIGNIAHQWRQPLNSLGLMIQEMAMSYEYGDFSKKLLDETVNGVMQLIQHMSQTIDDFRYFFRPDKEQVEFRVRNIIDKTISIIEPSLKEHNIKLAFSAGADPLIHGYPNELSQVMLNIMLNARDAFAEREISDRRVALKLDEKDGRAVITIQDNAGGIPDDILDKIFDPYFTTKGPDKGTGVGLYMSKVIIEKNMNGRLTVRNSEEGAEFRIEAGRGDDSGSSRS